MRTFTVAATFLALVLGACTNEKGSANAPVALEVDADAVGYYCGMLLQDHEGPKGQIHLASRKQPVWFSSARDTLAFTRLPEEPDDITAIYVNDMGRATNWASPEPGTWIDARQAWFVIDSRRQGGMGGPEAIPFGDEEKAKAFAAENGGRVVGFDDVPEAYVLGPTEAGEGAGVAAEPPPSQSGHDMNGG